jgi:hypothetical protein
MDVDDFLGLMEIADLPALSKTVADCMGTQKKTRAKASR